LINRNEFVLVSFLITPLAETESGRDEQIVCCDTTSTVHGTSTSKLRSTFIISIIQITLDTKSVTKNGGSWLGQEERKETQNYTTTTTSQKLYTHTQQFFLLQLSL
jgi:hypothetical protein